MPREVPRKEKYRPRSAAMILSDEVSGKIDRVCCGAVKIFMGNKSSPFCTFLQVRVCVAMKAPVGLLSGGTVCDSRWMGVAPTSSVGFAIKSISDCSEHQDGFANFIAVKR